MREPNRFISEDTTQSFEGWLKNRNFGPITPEQETILRKHYNEIKKRAPPKVGLMKLPPPAPGERRYAVTCRDGTDLWLTLWVRRSPKGEFFVMVPRGDREWDPHISYHLNGKFHSKSYDKKMITQERQPLSDTFCGTEHLGAHYGHAPKAVGAVCDPNAFSGVVEAPAEVLGHPKHGCVVVDLVQPGSTPIEWPGKVAREQVFKDDVPWVVIRIVDTSDVS